MKVINFRDRDDLVWKQRPEVSLAGGSGLSQRQAEPEIERLKRAKDNPKREGFHDPLDARLECALGRARVRGQISESEYQAGVRWRGVHQAYMRSITEDPDDLDDTFCEDAANAYKRGIRILENNGKRVLHAVNAIAVFDEPEELGDSAYTLAAAKIGFSALAVSF